MNRQIDKVMRAVRKGCRTSYEVSAMTGLPVKTASAWLSVLCRKRKIFVQGKIRLARCGADGHIIGLWGDGNEAWHALNRCEPEDTRIKLTRLDAYSQKAPPDLSEGRRW